MPYDSSVPKITFLPADVTIDVQPGTTVFNAAARAEVAIPSQCGGKCACALCRVEVMAGEELVSPMTWEEEGHMGNVFFLTRERLSCQLKVFGDVTVKIDEAPAKETRGRYIPYALVRKREKMEQEEELRRVAGGDRRPRRRDQPDRPPKRPAPGPSTRPPQRAADGDEQRGGPPSDGRPPGQPSRPKRRRRRRRNPGAPRPGESGPPKKGDS